MPRRTDDVVKNFSDPNKRKEDIRFRFRFSFRFRFRLVFRRYVV